jgi:RNA polymerase sigma-70 factor (ECF subfamily)
MAAESLDELIRAHSDAVYRIGLRIAANRADAEDILQEAWIQVHRNLHAYRGEARIETWIHRIAVNAALMHLRRTKRHRAESLDEMLPELDATDTFAHPDLDYGAVARADELLAEHELAALALDVLAEMPPQYRVPFVLRDLEEIAPDEVATLLEITPATLRQRVHRARLLLRARLAARLGSES